MREALPVAALLLVAVGVQVAMLWAGRIDWDSDTAVVAIMARDIQRDGAHPVFYYGSAYAGTLEPHWVAAVFAVAGVSVAAYRAAIIVLLVCLLVVVYLTARLGFGRAAALAAVAYLALPPLFFLRQGLTSNGSYDAVSILGGCVLLTALLWESALRQGRPGWGRLAALGLAAGLGWWVNPLILSFGLAVAAWFLLIRPRVFLRPAHYLVFGAAFLVGGLPWWVSNALHSWYSLHDPQTERAGVLVMLVQLKNFWLLAPPVLFGIRPAWQVSETFPGETLGSGVLYLVPALMLGVHVWRHRRGLVAGQGADDAEARAALLILFMLVVAPVLATVSKRTFFASPRFLFPLYAVFPIAFGFAICRLWRGPAWARAEAVALVGIALLSSAVSLTGSPPLPPRDGSDARNGSLSELIAELDRHDLQAVYGSYWIAYRLDFEADGRIPATPFGEWHMTRMPRYHDAA
ncbi:MAG TPA: glycosyltransferase family 39 protein, partial [Gemmataceae bacterium]|nr:glycosyltransferase family 39 protein [Gemmataceae bacterium]